MSADIRAILFDKDGTLLDFNRTWLGPYKEAASYVVARSNGHLDVATVLAAGGYIAATGTWKPDSLLASGSNQQIFDSWSEMLGSPLRRVDLQQIADIFTLGANQYIPVCDPLRPCLEGLHLSGFALGIATMDDEGHALNMARGLGIDDLFEFICGADSGHGVKPEPGMVQAFAQRLGLGTNQVAMVGDSPRDIKMGQNAGAGLSIAVLTGASSATELGEYTPHILSDITKLADFMAAI